MVMRLIFEVHQPLFRLSVHFYRNHNGTGINLVRFLLIIQLGTARSFHDGNKGAGHLLV